MLTGLNIDTFDPLTAKSRSLLIATAVTQESCPNKVWIGFFDSPEHNPLLISIFHTAHIRSAEPEIRCEWSTSKLIQVTISRRDKEMFYYYTA